MENKNNNNKNSSKDEKIKIDLILGTAYREFLEDVEPMSEYGLIKNAINLSGLTSEEFLRVAIRDKALQWVAKHHKDQTHNDILVIEAINKLKREGKTPTIGAIRFQIKNKCNHTVCEKMLKYIDPSIESKKTKKKS